MLGGRRREGRGGVDGGEGAELALIKPSDFRTVQPRQVNLKEGF